MSRALTLDTARWRRIGAEAASDDSRAGNVIDPLDEGMLWQHVGLDEGGVEERLLRAAGAMEADVEAARALVLAGYRGGE